MQLSTYLKNALFNATYRGIPFSVDTAYLALFTSDPTVAGTGTEVSGGAYERQPVVFSAPVDGVGANPSLVSFAQATADWGLITHAAFYDAVVGGDMLHFGALTVPKTINANDRIDFDVNDLSIGFL